MDYAETQITADLDWLNLAQHVERQEPSGELVATGSCRRCGHDTTYPIVTEDVVVAAVARPMVSLQLPRMFRCRCAQPHPRRPEEIHTGCGAYWFAAVTSGGSGYELSPLDPARIPAATAVDRAAAQQATLVQSVAEKWLGGVAALLAVFSLAGPVLATGAVTSLAPGWRITAAVAVVASVAAAAFAIYSGHRAAYGWLTAVPTGSDAASTDLESRSRNLAPRLAAFRRAVPAAGASLGLALVALMLIWLAPQASPPGPLVRVTYTDRGGQASACGTLLPAPEGSGGRIRIVEGPRTLTLTLPARIVNLTAVTSCPGS